MTIVGYLASNAANNTAEPIGVSPQNPLPVTLTGGLGSTPLGGLALPSYDYMAYTNTNTTTDTYKFYSGGAGGTLVATEVIVYTDTTKSQVSTLTLTPII